MEEEPKLTYYQRNREYCIAKAREYQQNNKQHYKEYYKKRYRSLNPVRQKKVFVNKVFVPKPAPAPKAVPSQLIPLIQTFEAERGIPSIKIEPGIFTVRFD